MLEIEHRSLLMAFSKYGVALGRDHTTILYGYDKISQQIEEDDGLRRDILAIRERLYNNG